MTFAQPGILEPVPSHARHLIFNRKQDGDLQAALNYLIESVDGRSVIVGLGQSLLEALGCEIKGMQTAPTYCGAAVEVPATPGALWLWLRGEERGDLVVNTRKLKRGLACAFELTTLIDCFRYRDSRDLTGYVDGTENPQGETAIQAAFIDSEVPGLKGSSFAALQQWLHNLEHFASLPQSEQDNIMGRRLADNEEFEEAPASAHVKRSAQESFTPAAFMLRRSMPWSRDTQEGLAFLSFGHSFQAFDAIMRRMVGLEDGITDGLFRFSQPITGNYFWCPPMQNETLDLSLLRFEVAQSC